MGMSRTTIRIRRLVLEGVDPDRRGEAAKAFQDELARLLTRWPAGSTPADGDPVRARPGVLGPPPVSGTPAAVGEQAALAVHRRLLGGDR